MTFAAMEKRKSIRRKQMFKLIRWIAGWIFVNTLCGILHLHVYNPYWWALTFSFYFILGFTED